MKIGFFDSGLGGLLILKAVREHMPEYDYVYLGDTKHLPYGDKTEDEIYELAHKGIDALFNEGVSLVIVACNTVSAEALRHLQDTVFNNKYPNRRVLGVIIPTIETIIDTKAKNALLVATQRTVSSKKFEAELKKFNSKINLRSIATPTLVSKIEEHQFDYASEDLMRILTREVGEVDTLILGCTHYTVLKDIVRKAFPELQVISQDEIIPKKIEQYLENHPEIKSNLSKNKTVQIMVTKESEKYDKIKKEFLDV